MEKIKEIPYYGKCKVKEVVVIKSRPMKMTPFLIKLQKEKEKEIATKELDKFLARLRKKNGQSESIIS